MIGVEVTKDEILQFAIENGIISHAHIETAILQMEKQKIDELVKKNKNKPWLGKDGRWKCYVIADGKRKLLSKATESELRKSIANAVVAEEENPTLGELFRTYNDGRMGSDQISPSTRLRYGQVFEKYYGEIENKRVKTITADFLCEYMERTVAKYNMTSKAFVNLKTITRGLFKRAYRKKYVSFRVEEEVMQVLDLSDKKFKRVVKDDSEEVFSDDECKRYYGFLSQNVDVWNLAILIMLVSGIRGGEVCTLKHDDFERHDGFFVIYVHRTETKSRDVDGNYRYDVKETPKSEAGIRHVVVPRQHLWILDEVEKLGNEGWAFTNPNDGKRITTNSVRSRQRTNCNKLKIVHKSPHKLRKTYASILLDNAIDKNFIIQQMGHTDIETTEKFYHKNMKNYDRKAEILSGIKIC